MAEQISRREGLSEKFRVRGSFPRTLDWRALAIGLFVLPLCSPIGCSLETDRSVPAGVPGSANGNRPPVVQRAAIVPNPILLNGQISVQVEAEDPDRNPLTFRHQWFINGHRAEGETRPTLAPGMLKRGDKVHVEVLASDGQTEGMPYQAAMVVVGNTPPDVTKVVIGPSGSDRTQFRATVEGVDIDNDDIRYVYRWRRNTAVVSEGDRSTLDTATFARGDSLTVEVTPHDAGGPGSSKLSDPIVLGNSAPQITSLPPAKYEKGVFSYSVQATDDDKDVLRYELATAPPGMKIDSATGIISWNVGSEVKGPYRVRVVVQDGQGGSASQDFDVAVASPNPAS